MQLCKYKVSTSLHLLQSNEKEFQKVIHDENYSPIFKILLQRIQEEDGELMRRKRGTVVMTIS